MDRILYLEDGDMAVSVFADYPVYKIYTYFASREVWSERKYLEPSKAISDARTIFYLLNGIGELMQLRKES